MAIQAFTLLLLLTQWTLLTHTQEVAELVSFGFSTTITLALGSPPQILHLLPTFYTSPSTTLLVPTGSICLSASSPPEGDWNPITEPREGSFVGTSSSDEVLVLGGSSQIVRWRASPDVKSLNLTLRRGRGQNIMNVSLIEAEISNDGQYPWNANSTYRRANLTSGSDYSLMLWTEDPPRRSISRFFTMGPANSTSNSTTISALAEATEEYAACIRVLGKNGYYNETLDGNFISGVTLGQGIGTTAASWNTTKPRNEFSLEGLPVNVIYESVLGYGMVGLSALQRARNSRVPEMDVVSLYLGSEGLNGSAVMGGFDEGLIDHGNKAVFSKANVNSEGFDVTVTSVKYIGGGGGGSRETEVYKSTTGGTHMALSYNSSQLRLPPEMLTPLLPLLGSPRYDKGVHGYVYTGTPPTDYILRIALSNGTSGMVVNIPATSLITTDENTDNPLTSQRESGQTYLRIAPVSPTDGPSLGRPFLEHIYLINAPPTINKFHLSAVPSPARKSNLTPASRSSIAIFLTDSTPTNSTPRDTPAIGPMIGGILGGVAFLVLAIIAYITTQRRRARSQSLGSRHTVGFAPSSSSPSTLYDQEGEKPRTRSLVTSTNLSAFEKEVGVFAMPPNYRYRQQQRSASAPSHRPHNGVLGATRKTVSQQSTRHRRESENSTVARVLSSTPSPTLEIYEVSEGSTAANTATMGKFYPGAGLIGPPPPIGTPSSSSSEARVVFPARAHVRTASIGRMVTPVHVEFSPGTSRRSSVRTQPPKRRSEMEGGGRSSGETDQSSIFGLRAVAKDGEFLRKEEARGGYLRVGEEDGDGDGEVQTRR
ncbi:hypothetical protein HOY80DRAFT_431132 [Tuber brumale]|nr:hypothetical protein HOY80DRAFT_431132 [Tuber brumale]